MTRHSKNLIDLSSAVVLVTGGARGIGLATAQLFAQQGSTVWIGDVDAEIAAEAAAGIPGVQSAYLDVTDPISWQKVLEQIEAPIDVLVNNAGVMPLGGFVEESQQVTDLILDVNIKGPLYGMRAVLPTMTTRGHGHIVNVASMAGMIAIPGMVTYNASKYGALGLSLGAREEFRGTGVSVSAILPAAVRTELSSGAQLGSLLPTVDPIEVATAIVASVRHRRARTSVPRYLTKGWGIIDAVAPAGLVTAIRRLADDRRALNLADPEARRGYNNRIAQHSLDHSTQKSSTQKSSTQKSTTQKSTTQGVSSKIGNEKVS